MGYCIIGATRLTRLMTAPELTLDTVTLERDGHVLVIGLNRPDKRNAFNLAMLADLSRAYGLLESDDSLRAGVLFAHGDHFTAGLDLVDVGPNIVSGELPFPDDGRDPWRLDGDVDEARRRRRARLVHDAGHRVAAGRRHPGRGRRHPVRPDGGASRDLPVRRRHHPAAAADRMGQRDAVAAHRRRVRRRRGAAHRAGAGGRRRCRRGAGRRARAIAHTIADRAAPLGVRAVLASAHLARTEGDGAAIDRLRPEMTRLFGTADAAEGVQSFIERREARFQGSLDRATLGPVAAEGLAMGHYKSNVRDLEFNLFEVLELEKALATGEFGDLDGESVRQMLDEASRLAEGPLAESFADADRNPPTFDPDDARGDPARVVQEVTPGLAAGRVVPGRPGRGRSAGCPRPRWSRGRSTSSRSAPSPRRSCIWPGPIMADILYHIGNEQQRHWASLTIERNWGATMVLDRARRRIGCRRGPHEGGAAARRHLAPRRRQAVHHQRRHRRSVREHHAPGACPARGRRTGHQGPEPVPGAEVPARSRDRRTRRAQRRLRHRARAQDGSEGVRDVRAHVRPARHARRRAGWSATPTTASPRCSRSSSMPE